MKGYGKEIKDMPVEKWVDSDTTHPDAIDLVYNDIITKIAPKGKVLGAGDSPFPHAVLNMKYFHDHPVEEGHAINIEKSHEGSLNNFKVIHGDANDMPYEDNYFDFVYTVMMLEHNPNFWLSVQEMHRVLNPGSPLMIAIPGFVGQPEYAVNDPRDHWGHGTSCYENHTPCDCYRFSPDFFKFFALKDFDNAVVYHAMFPPRLIGVGYKPNE